MAALKRLFLHDEVLLGFVQPVQDLSVETRHLWDTRHTGTACKSDLSRQTEEVESSFLRDQRPVLTGSGTPGQKSHRIHRLCSWCTIDSLVTTEKTMNTRL
ncbi:hypothetical protein EYF80_025350 [Liparis tanakae]|uniref:Uncharacterized protein n=1 Tax=Liparis tanakae TaxID=230148 RepID=A0A4Z2HFT8_9TELE|nr:hypothetical protein EYF80_025350 [Liparis tanakae]